MLLCTTALVGLPGVARAQSEEDPTLLGVLIVKAQAGSKLLQSVSEVPQSVSVVGRGELDKQPGAKADEVLRTTAGVTAMPYGTDSDTDWFAIRGFQADQTGVFMDGMSLYQLGFATISVDPYLLEQVEVLKGPASGLYGGPMSAVSSIMSASGRRAKSTFRPKWGSTASAMAIWASTWGTRPRMGWWPIG